MKVGTKFEDTYRDTDVLEVRVSGWNGASGEVADVYVGIGRLGEVATLLQGFPSSVTDSREFTLGAFGGEFAGGGVSQRFRSCGGAAQVVVDRESRRTQIRQFRDRQWCSSCRPKPQQSTPLSKSFEVSTATKLEWHI